MSMCVFLVFSMCVCLCVPGRRGGGDGTPSQGHLVDVIVAGAVQISQGEVGTGRCSHWS